MNKILLTIAGYDPTSGAGAVLDINVFQHLGFTGMGIITSLTAQNTMQVSKVYCPPPNLILDQYKSLGDDVKLSGIKVGMLGCKKNISPVTKILSLNSLIPRVIDPVFQSSSGTWLLEPAAIPNYIKAIAGQITILTPNAHEAGLITGFQVKTLKEMERAAKNIHELCEAPCLITGGHFEKEIADLLFDGENTHVFKHKKIDAGVHGTGCFLSSALLSYLCRGEAINNACQLAINRTYSNITRSVRTGHGQNLFSPLHPNESKTSAE
ncbi:MAG: bifunctional hydroxymethylpyrimidine kinase/phosphomethylpyrimidine kinase [Candidatus Aminicenantes bacterium]|nr:bifunctional hydroxymethylpyrimidine kinase/phosphomethylpyrimidine kinase [Candidatus Aminicenantes bacterium]